MFAHKLKATALALCLLAALATGAGWLNRPAARADEPRPAPAATTDRRHDPAPMPIPGRMTVVGRVLDPSGQPVPNASVMVYGAPKQGDERPGSDAPAPLGQAAGDGSGRYRLDMPRISSATHYMVGVAARAPGFGMGWVDLGVDADQPAADITLRPEQIIEGRLFDIKGRVVLGVRVSVEGLGHPRRGPEAYIPEFIEGPHLWGGAYAKTPPAWPASAVSDAEGRFAIRGVGRDLRALLMADDPEYARQRIVVDTDGAPGPKAVSAALEPAKVLTGRITCADTGKPVPHAVVEIYAYTRPQGGPGYTNHYETDDQGSYRANPISGVRYMVVVYVPRGQPYLNASSGEFPFAWPQGKLEHRVDLALRRAAVIRGKVTEEGTGRPVAGAMLRYIGQPVGVDESGSWTGTARTGPDGWYQVAVRPRPSMLAVLGPSEDYVLQEMGERMVHEGRPGGGRLYAHAFVPCDLKPGTDSREVNVVIRRGTTVTGRVVGPDGNPVAQARVFSRLLLQPQPWPWRHFSGECHGDVHDGHCELHGLAEGAEVPVFFFDPKQQLGATAMFSARSAKSGPIAVRLEPCGQAMARLVDSNGKPLAGYRDPYLISMVITPGPDRLSDLEADKAALSSEGDYLSRIDPEHYADLVSDAQGRITFPALIPGATYRINDMTTRNDPGGRKSRATFVAGAGEAIELGDVLIAKPEP
jgi:protocatechuate 3,4-dioxygenase beta subunit